MCARLTHTTVLWRQSADLGKPYFFIEPIYRPGTRQQLTNVWMLRLPLAWLSTHVRQPFEMGSVVTQTLG